jgi:hypothetical protein
LWNKIFDQYSFKKFQITSKVPKLHECESKKTTLLQTWVCRAGLQRFANVLFCGRGFFFLCAGEKKQNKFPRTAPPYQRSTNPINPFFAIISIFFQRINVSSWWWFSHTCLQRFEYEAAGIFKASSVSPVSAFNYRQVVSAFNSLLCLVKVLKLKITAVSPLTYIYCCAASLDHALFILKF